MCFYLLMIIDVFKLMLAKEIVYLELQEPQNK